MFNFSARYLNVSCIFVSKYLIAFSVSVINSLIYYLGFFSIAQSHPKFKVFICSRQSFICFKFTSLVWNVCFVVSLLWLTALCSCSASSFFIKFLV